eukprot:6618710-Pyramimonas_sp.AAC.2
MIFDRQEWSIQLEDTTVHQQEQQTVTEYERTWDDFPTLDTTERIINVPPTVDKEVSLLKVCLGATLAFRSCRPVEC